MVHPSTVPCLPLPSGGSIPMVGLGTWLAEPGEIHSAIIAAIKSGYRHIDCAYLYGNEAEIGSAIAQCIADGLVERSELFITIKVWSTFHSNAAALQNVTKSLHHLQTSYVDLCLIHAPMGLDENVNASDEDPLRPKDEEGRLRFSNIDYLETWHALEEMQERGIARHIGLSNFNSEQIARIIEHCRVRPSVLQIEAHVYLAQTRLQEFCREHSIALTAYCPLGGRNRPFASAGEAQPLDDETVNRIAERHGKSTAQVLLKYLVQRGFTVIPKSVRLHRIEENIALFDFHLSEGEMEELVKLDRNKRYMKMPAFAEHKYWPFAVEF